MSNAVLGALEIQMLADLARLRTDMNDAKSIVGNAMNSIKGAATAAMGGLVAGLGIAAFGSWIKGAIDAGDEAFNLSKKLGMPVKDLAGLQLAFKQAGVDGGSMQTAMVKLSKNVADGGDVFKRMGVSVRDADGSLKGSKRVLYDVADVFAAMPDGIQKTALATEVFGKAGADLLPMLAEGSQGMKDMAAMAERLGLVIDDEAAAAADGFNDTVELLGMATQGMGRQVAAQLLPTLKSLAGTFLDNVTSGDKLKKGADILSGGLKLLFIGGSIGVEVFNTLGKVVAGVAGALVSVAQGEFGQAWKILEESGRDIGQGWGDTAKTIEDVWTGAGTTTVNQAIAMTGATRGATVATKEQAEAAKKMEAEQAKLTKAGQDYLSSLNEQYAALQQEISLGRALTDGEKEQIKLTDLLAKGKMVLTAEEEASARAKLAEMDATRQQRAAAEDYLKTLAAVAQHSSKWNDEQIKTTESLRAGNVALIEENTKLGLSDAAWAARQRAVLLSQAADLEWQAANEGGNFQLEEQARLLRERAQLSADGVVLKEAKAAADEWKKTTESIQAGLTDALMRAFESGKGFLDAFKDTLLNAFRTLILQPMVKSMVGQLSGSIQGVMGLVGSIMGTVGSGSAGGGDMGSIKSNNSGAYGAAGAGAAGTGWVPYVGWGIAALQYGSGEYDSGWTAQAARNGKDNILGGDVIGRNFSQYSVDALLTKFGQKLGMTDKWASIMSGETAMAHLIGRQAPRVVGSGITGEFGLNGFSGSNFADWKAKGGLFRSDKSGTATSPLDAELGAQMSSAAAAIFTHVASYAEALAMPVEALTSITSKARIELGTDAAANQAAIDSAIAMYGEALVKTYESTLSGYASAGESSIDTLNRLGGSLLSVNSVFETLGLHLMDTSLAGGQAASELIALTGGLDSFMAKTQSYLANYYTQGEQSGISAKNILQTLSAAGIDASAFNDRADLRGLLETLDPNATNPTYGPIQGPRSPDREQMAALLNVSADFAKLTDYLAETGQTLGDLAAQAPQSPLGGTMGIDPVEQSNALLQTANDNLASIAAATQANTTELQALVAVQSAGTQSLIDRLREIADGLTNAMRPGYLAEMAQQ